VGARAAAAAISDVNDESSRTFLTTPSSKRLRTVRPTVLKTSCMSALPGRTVAVNVSRPRSWAMTARRSRSKVATPSRWWSSATANATSASVGVLPMMYSPIPISSSPIVEQRDVLGALADDAEQFTFGEVTPKSEEPGIGGRVAESGVEATYRLEVGR
jgi:hypothetical protein